MDQVSMDVTGDHLTPIQNPATPRRALLTGEVNLHPGRSGSRTFSARRCRWHRARHPGGTEIATSSSDERWATKLT